MNPWPHIPVMCEEIVEAIDPQAGETIVDCTLGMGGHTEALLRRADCRVIGLDRDPAALAIAAQRLAEFGDRFVAIHAAFADLSETLDRHGVGGVHGIVADLGVSSLQLDTPDRGFSFRLTGPLDMRMDPSAPLSAATFVEDVDEGTLAKVIAEFGEERHARRIARVIVQGRPWADTTALAGAIAEAVPARGAQRIHPATRTFQAIRIHVNGELEQLQRLLPAAADALLPGGRLAILAFHSLEDRLVKRFLAQQSGRDVPKDPYGNPLVPPRLTTPGKALQPSPDDPNPRARSARLRTAVRLP